MDIDLLSKMVKELILDSDKVVLPGLGSFVAEIVPSIFTDRGYTINPPYRKMYFREKPDEGTALAEFYAAENGVGREVAERIIRDFVDELKETLYTKKVVVFPGLGRLRATKENNVFFIADEDLNIYPEGFGLEPISLKTHQETSEEVSAAVEDLKSILDEHDVFQEELPAAEEPDDDASAPEFIEETVSEEVDEISAPKKKKPLLKAFIIILLFAAVLFAAFAFIGRNYPELIDKYLYTPEELEILNQ